MNKTLEEHKQAIDDAIQKCRRVNFETEVDYQHPAARAVAAAIQAARLEVGLETILDVRDAKSLVSGRHIEIVRRFKED